MVRDGRVAGSSWEEVDPERQPGACESGQGYMHRMQVRVINREKKEAAAVNWQSYWYDVAHGGRLEAGMGRPREAA